MDRSRSNILILLVIHLLPMSLSAWDPKEHSAVADSAFYSVVSKFAEFKHESIKLTQYSDCEIHINRKLWRGMSFGQISSYFSGNDASFARYHEKGKTVLQQLYPLKEKLIEKVWRNRHKKNHLTTVSNKGNQAGLAEQPDKNVLLNFLLHHLIALRFAKLASEQNCDTNENLVHALIYEANAQSYLMDSFSSGHMLVPFNHLFYKFHKRNNITNHDHFRNTGIYVLNSRGDAWQAFGDKLLSWYKPTKDHVLEACRASLREVFIVYYSSKDENSIPTTLKTWIESTVSNIAVSELVKEWLKPQSGDQYYLTGHMPSTLMIPTPVSAAWSIRTDKINSHGIYRRHYYFQYIEDGFHDTNLNKNEQDFLYSVNDVPEWMTPSLVRMNSHPASIARLIKFHPDIASVQYVQRRNFSPSYKGLLFHIGGGKVFSEEDIGSGSLFGIGYGLVGDLFVINNISIDLQLFPSLDNPRRLIIAPSFGLGIKLPDYFLFLNTFRMERGYAWGLRSPYKSHGGKYAVGIEFPPISLGFAYIGLTPRILYQRFDQEQTKHAVFFQFVLH